MKEILNKRLVSVNIDAVNETNSMVDSDYALLTGRNQVKTPSLPQIEENQSLKQFQDNKMSKTGDKTL